MPRLSKRLVRAAVLAIATSMLASCERGAERPFNVIVISIDTLRADRLSCYGYERRTTPEIDRFAQEAVLFENAIAPSPWTLPSHLTMLSGLYPSTHGVTTPTKRPSRATKLLAEILGAAGWHPFALTDGAHVSAEMGFGPGFREFEDTPRTFAQTLARAQEFIETLAPPGTTASAPYFAFLHTYDVHCPYDPGEPWDSMFITADAVPIETAGRCGNPDFNALALTPGQARHLSDRYDGGVSAADTDLGRFFDFLRSSGELDRSIVVVTSDHGEEFLEHGQIGHERSLHAELLRVPLIIHVPGVGPRRVEEPASLADLVPTLLELVDVRAPEGGLDGTSVAAALRGEPSAGADFRFSELSWQVEQRSWMGAREHLIEDRATGRARLFQLVDDPYEQNDVAENEPELVAELRAKLGEFDAALSAGARAVHEVGLPVGAVADELDALGYRADR